MAAALFVASMTTFNSNAFGLGDTPLQVSPEIQEKMDYAYSIVDATTAFYAIQAIDEYLAMYPDASDRDYWEGYKAEIIQLRDAGQTGALLDRIPDIIDALKPYGISIHM